MSIISAFIIFFALQIIFWKFGLFATAGLMRYFITVLPLAIISICIFFDYIFKTTKDIFENYLIVFVLCGLQIFFTSLLFIRGDIVFNQQTKANFNIGYTQAGEWIKDHVDKSTKIYSDVPEVIYFAERDLNNATIFGVTEAYNTNQKATYVFNRGAERSSEFLEQLKGDYVSFNNTVYVVSL